MLAPDIANIRDSRNLLDFLNSKRGESRQVKVVINKSDIAKRTRLLPKDISNTLGIQPVAAIPFDPATFIEAANDGKMIGDRFKSHKLIGVFTDLVDAGRRARAAPRAVPKPQKKSGIPELVQETAGKDRLRGLSASCSAVVPHRRRQPTPTQTVPVAAAANARRLPAAAAAPKRASGRAGPASSMVGCRRSSRTSSTT